MGCRPFCRFTHLTGLVLVLTTGAKNGRIPWGRLQKHRDDYIKPKYLPEDIEIKGFHHLLQDHVNSMLKHWTERQAAGKVPLEFKKATMASSEDDDDAGAESGELGGESQQGDYESQSGEKSGEGSQGNDENRSGDEGSQGDRGRAGSTGPGESPGGVSENPSRVGWLLKHNDSRR